jgi:hypothetical protein
MKSQTLAPKYNLLTCYTMYKMGNLADKHMIKFYFELKEIKYGSENDYI